MRRELLLAGLMVGLQFVGCSGEGDDDGWDSTSSPAPGTPTPPPQAGEMRACGTDAYSATEGTDESGHHYEQVSYTADCVNGLSQEGNHVTTGRMEAMTETDDIGNLRYQLDVYGGFEIKGNDGSVFNVTLPEEDSATVTLYGADTQIFYDDCLFNYSLHLPKGSLVKVTDGEGDTAERTLEDGEGNMGSSGCEWLPPSVDAEASIPGLLELTLSLEPFSTVYQVDGSVFDALPFYLSPALLQLWAFPNVDVDTSN